LSAIEQLPLAEATPAETGRQHGSLGTMAIGALGVVYGDIGTIPLSTFKTAIDWAGGQATPAFAALEVTRFVPEGLQFGIEVPWLAHGRLQQMLMEK